MPWPGSVESSTEMTFRRFEDIAAWQQARILRAAVYNATRGRSFGKDFALRNQLRRAAISVMANIAEGFTHRSDRHFAQFLFAAKASAAEVQSHLYASLDEHYISQAEFNRLYDAADHCSRQMSNLISHLLRGNNLVAGRKRRDDSQRVDDHVRLDAEDAVDSADAADVS